MRQAIQTEDGSLGETEQALGSLREEAGESRAERPFSLSVIIPVRNDPGNLDHCLTALKGSDFFDYELIVIDDASTDSTAEVARRHGAELIRQPVRSGPAAARNLGARAARHDYLFFLDADVGVRPDTLRRVASRFESDPALDAFFGSYDASPGASGFVSQYRNLLHHYVHQSASEDAFSFWSGCGAIKRNVFLEIGGFDAGFSNASIEDIELGSRLDSAGHRVALVKSIQVKHLKGWTFWNMLRTDVMKRGIPWTLLILRQGKMPNDLNLRHGQRLSAVFAAGLPAALVLAAWTPSQLPALGVLAVACIAGILLLNLGFYRFLSRAKHPLFALCALPLHVLYYLCSGIAFVAGLLLHLGRGCGRPHPDSS